MSKKTSMTRAGDQPRITKKQLSAKTYSPRLTYTQNTVKKTSSRNVKR